MKDWFDLLLKTLFIILIGILFSILMIVLFSLKNEITELKNEIQVYQRMVEQDISLYLKEVEF